MTDWSAFPAAPASDAWAAFPTATDFDARFKGEQTNAAPMPGLQRGLENRATAMTTGPQLSPTQHIATEFTNIGPAASQGTTPNVEAHQGNLISAETFEGDDGSIQFRDPATGQVVPTDQNKHVAIRDPKDGKVKVFSRAEATNESPLVSASRIAVTGLAAGAPTARAAVGTVKHVEPTASDIMATAKPHYRAFKNVAGQVEIPAETATGIADRLRGALERINLTEEMAGAPARSAIALLESGKIVTLADLQKVKRMAGRGFNASEKDARDAAGALSSEISRIIGQVSGEASESLKTADAIHSTALAVQDLQRKEAVAGLRAGRAGYGGNAVNSMRQVLSPIVEKATKGQTTSFKPHEIEAMRAIVEGSPVINSLRLAGSFSPHSGLGVLRSAGGGGVAMMAGATGPQALLIPALGYASNKLATVLTGKQIEHLKELVAKRSPEYAKAVERAVDKYERAQVEFVTNPSPAKFAGYLSASRALSAGLTRDGVQVTSGDLLRSIQGPMRSAAEDEQQ